MIQNIFQILLVDDHVLVRQGLCLLINSNKKYHVAGDAQVGSVALKMLQENSSIDIVVFVLTHNNKVDSDFISQILKTNSNSRILVLSMLSEIVYAEHAIKSGVHGFVMKHESTEILFKAISEVIQDRSYFSEILSASILKRVKQNSNSADGEGLLDRLSASELLVLKLISSGHTSIEIAMINHRSVKTVESHRANIRFKLELRNNADLIRFATLSFPPIDWGDKERRNTNRRVAVVRRESNRRTVDRREQSRDGGVRRAGDERRRESRRVSARRKSDDESQGD